MFKIISESQLDVMLLLCGACGMITLLLMITRFLSQSRRRIMVLMELVSFFLLLFDRMSYIYSGSSGTSGYVMVRLSNFMVFLLTSATVFSFNLYLRNYLTHEGRAESLPKRLEVTGILSVIGMLLAVIAAFTNLYYYFDEANVYHRGRGFLIAYIIPVLCPIIQFTVIWQYRKRFSKIIYIAMVLYIFVPIGCGILQIFTYGLSLVNMAMVAVSISLYLFTYLDINNTVKRAHETEIQTMQGEKERMQKLFGQTALAFMSAVEQRDEFAKGHAVKIAEYAKRIAELAGKDSKECERVYYAALLHDIGLIGIPDSVIKKMNPDEADYEAMRRKPEIGKEILSHISEYPYLSDGAHYSHERYNGTGYPEGLKGNDIPEIARIIGVADAYVSMTTRKPYREARPSLIVREAFVKGSGEEFDPQFSEIMVRIIDAESSDQMQKAADETETEITCHEYRENVTNGIPVEAESKRITFECIPDNPDGDHRFSAPSFILFDSYDKRVHENEKAVQAYHYVEYGEFWFDGHSIQTAARKIKERFADQKKISLPSDEPLQYEIVTGRCDDHLQFRISGPSGKTEVTVALPGSSEAAYVALTGENCTLKNITVELTGETTGPDEIARIAEKISYTDRMESDLPNIQIDRLRSASTEGTEVKDGLVLAFHTMSLPGANLVWHCPYVVLFSSADGQVGGKDYREFGLIKLNGENEGDTEFAHNSILVRKTEAFPDGMPGRNTTEKAWNVKCFSERKEKRLR